MKAVRLHEYHQLPVVEEVPDPTAQGPLDVVVKIGGVRGLPDRPAHHRGSVGGGTESHAALHPRPRERRLGARDRPCGDERGSGRHGDPAPAAQLRVVPGLPGPIRRCYGVF
jgi:hypothetical protein